VRWLLPFALLGAGLLSSVGARAAEPSGFTLETGSPDALCPELEVTREVVGRRLGSLVVEGRKGWRARYTIGHAPSSSPHDFIRLELFNPEGRVELLRDLPIEGASCRIMADVIALVLDRYFRSLGESERWTAESDAVTVPRPAARPLPTSPPRPQKRSPRLARRVSAEYVVTEPVAQPWLGLKASTTLGSSLEVALGLRFGLTPLRERAPLGASVDARAGEGRLGLAWRIALPLGLLHLGPVASLALEHATALGLADRTDRTRVRWAAGVEGGFVVPIGHAFFCETTIFADFLGGSGRFFIGEREVLSPHWLTLGGSLGFGYSWPQQ